MMTTTQPTGNHHPIVIDTPALKSGVGLTLILAVASIRVTHGFSPAWFLQTPV